MSWVELAELEDRVGRLETRVHDVRRGARRLRVAERIVAFLSAPNALEAYASLLALAWGLLTGFDHSYLTHAHTAALNAMVHGESWILGGPMAAFGLVGMWALWTKRRAVRAHCAIGAAVMWLMLAAYYALVIPPVTSAAVAYACSALAEAWVYVRVSNRFDEVRRVGRDQGRGPRSD